ncbi:MAG: hypothetical protein F6K39_32245 [Okeania sp. SIO3B3]|nr:hypothetical protein [Okeania sp. SIO3B3]
MLKACQHTPKLLGIDRNLAVSLLFLLAFTSGFTQDVGAINRCSSCLLAFPAECGANSRRRKLIPRLLSTGISPH